MSSFEHALYEVTGHDRPGERWFRSVDLDFTFKSNTPASPFHIDFRRGPRVFQILFENNRLRILHVDEGDRATRVNPAAVFRHEAKSLPDTFLERYHALSPGLPDELRAIADAAIAHHSEKR